MKACVDVDYRGAQAVAACVLFREWTDEETAEEVVAGIASVEEYAPGEFYRRELPCLLAVLRKVESPLELVVVDGYVWLRDENAPGLGARLFEALKREVPVVGVAKTKFAGSTTALPVVRGETASRPLFVTSVGIAVEAAARHVQSMHGPYRIPTVLRRVDRLCRECPSIPSTA